MGGSKEVDEISPDKPWKVHRRRLARPPSLLSLNKNYARRMDTLFKKAYEASEAAIDDPARRRCRIAVIQELDGNRSVFLSHEDETWPPSRDTLHANFEIRYPKDFRTLGRMESRSAMMLERDHLDDNADLSPSPIAQEEYTGNPQAPHVRRLTERQDSFHSQSSSQPTLLQACEFSVDTSLGRPSITSPRSPDTDTRRTQSLNRLSDSSTMPRTVSTPPLGIVDFDRPSKYSTNSNALPASPSSLAGVLPSPPTASWDQLLSAPVEPNTSEQPRYDQPFIVPTTEQHYVPSHGKVTPALAGGTSSLNALEPKSRSPSTCTPAAKKAVPSTPPPIWSRRRGRTSKLGTPNSPGTSRTPPPHKLSTASVSRPSIMKRLKGRAR